MLSNVSVIRSVTSRPRISVMNLTGLTVAHG